MKFRRSPQAAFTLLEVMVAIAIFFGGLFAILGLVSDTLAGARHLERPMLDASVVASNMSLTNKLIEGVTAGDLSDLLGPTYSGCQWNTEIQETQTNKLFGVHITLQGAEGNKPVQSEMWILLYRPESPAGSMEGATVAR